MKISGTGSVLPKKIVTNDMLAQFLDTSDEWIRTRTGVVSRHVISDERLEDMAIEAARKALDEAGVGADQVDHYMLHQANIRIINAIQEYLEQPKEKFPTNIEDHGNSSSSCCPILLDECKKKGLLKKGEIIAMSAFGAGFVSGAVLFEW